MKKLIASVAMVVALTSCNKVDDIIDPVDEDPNTESSITYANGEFELENALAYYPFNGDANNKYDNYDGVPENPKYGVDRFGNSNSCFTSELNSYVDIFDDGDFDFQSDFSVSYWFKADNRTAQKFYEGHLDIVSKWVFSPTERSYYIGLHSNDHTEFWIREDIDYMNNGVQSVFDDQWHNHTVTYSAEHSRMTSYLDGELAGSANSPLPQQSKIPLRIGARPDLYSDFSGCIDDVMIFGSVISSADITKIAEMPQL